MYLKCPRQYELRYVEGKKSPPGVALIEGTCMHDALEFNNKAKKKSKKDKPTNKVVEAFNDSFSDKKKEIGDWQGEKENSIRARSETSISNYMGKIAPKITDIEGKIRSLQKMKQSPK